MLGDSHCHLDWFKAPKQVVERASKEGVSRIISASTDAASMVKNLELASSFKEVGSCLGIHPSNLLSMKKAEIKSGFAFAEENISKATGIGEVGIDFKDAKTQAQKDLQEDLFRRFIGLSLEHKMPISVHARYAETRCLDILDEMGAEKVHMHWFTNSKKTSARAVSLGYMISCGPIIIGDKQSAEVVSFIPLENLLFETDAPVPFFGENSEPSWVKRVAEKVAELKEEDFEVVSNEVEKNFKSLFG